MNKDNLFSAIVGTMMEKGISYEHAGDMLELVNERLKVEPIEITTAKGETVTILHVEHDNGHVFNGIGHDSDGVRATLNMFYRPEGMTCSCDFKEAQEDHPDIIDLTGPLRDMMDEFLMATWAERVNKEDSVIQSAMKKLQQRLVDAVAGNHTIEKNKAYTILDHDSKILVRGFSTDEDTGDVYVDGYIFNDDGDHRPTRVLVADLGNEYLDLTNIVPSK